MSDGPVDCPHCGDPFEWSLSWGYHCPTCRIAWDAKFPVFDHITPIDEGRQA